MSSDVLDKDQEVTGFDVQGESLEDKDVEEEVVNTEEKQVDFDPASLAPGVARIEMRTWKRDEILAISSGQVKNVVSLDNKNIQNLDDEPGGIFYHEIFGRSKDSISKSRGDSFKKEEKKRMNNWGHIELPIPVVHPGLIEKGYLQKLIGLEKPEVLKQVAYWDAYIAKPRLDMLGPVSTSLVTERSIDLVDTFIESHKTALKAAAEDRKIRIVPLINRHKGNYGEQGVPKCEKLIIISKDLFNGDASASFGDLKLKKFWQDMFVLLPGSYAIMDLLSDINVDEEIKYLEGMLMLLVENRYTAAGGDKSLMSSYLDLGKKDALIDRLSTRLQLLIGLKKQNMDPTDYVTDIIPVQPAHWRDRVKMTTGGVTKITQDGINFMYNNIIEKANTIKQNLGSMAVPYEDLKNYKTYDPERRSDVAYKIRSVPFDSTLESSMKSIQTMLYDYTMNSKEIDAGKRGKFASLLKRTSGKTDNNRGNVLGKRCDYTGRSVITVDQTLNLDEIGIPYDILKVHFKDELVKKLVEDKTLNLTPAQASEKIEHLGASYYNPISKNSEYNRFTVTYKANQSRSYESKIFNILVEILKTKRYLAIRYPSLHKWNGLGYKIKIVFDQTIHLNPLVCEGYNADFDGDQMSLFALTLPESVKEVDEILAPIKNDMNANGDPQMTPGQDMIMGLYILTLKSKDFDSQEIKAKYSNIDQIYHDLELGKITLHDKIEFLNTHFTNSMFRNKIYYDTIDKSTYRGDFSAINGIPPEEEAIAIYTTQDGYTGSTLSFDESPIDSLPDVIKYARMPIVSTVGRVIFNSLIPQNLGYIKRSITNNVVEDAYNPVNFALEWDPPYGKKVATASKELTDILRKVAVSYNPEVNAFVRDLFKSEGYKYVSQSGISIALSDINTVSGRDEAIEEGWKRVEANKAKYVGEELRKANIAVWKEIDSMLTKRMMDELPDDNPIKLMAVSGARGKVSQIKQMNTFRGIMMDASNKEIDTPILKNFSDGLDPVAFTISSYGACKGIIDRSNKTAETGDLTRHLTYGLSTIVVSDGDCGDREGTLVKDYYMNDNYPGNPTKDLISNLTNKVPLGNIILPGESEPLFTKDTAITKSNYKDLDKRINNFQEAIDQGNVKITDFRFKADSPLKQEIIGKTPIFDIVDKETGDIIFLANRPVFYTYYTDFEERLEKLQEQYGEEGVRLRSVRTCKSPTGVCARCTGYFFANHAHAKLGDAIGQVTAHAVSERATQLTMRTFHTGGIAEGDISAGFAQIKKTLLHGHVSNAEINGYLIPSINLITSDDIKDGIAKFNVLKNTLSNRAANVKTNELSSVINGITYDGLTLAHFGILHEDLFIRLSDAFLHEVRDAYMANEIYFKPIHFELIARQSVGNMRIVYSEDSIYRIGETIKLTSLIKENLKLAHEGKEPILAIPTLAGYKKLVFDADNPITSLFFQRSQEVIIDTTMRCSEDIMTSPITALGLGNTLPTGKGYSVYKELVRKDLNKPVRLITDLVKDYDKSNLTVGEIVENETELEVQTFDEPVVPEEQTIEAYVEEAVDEEVQSFDEVVYDGEEEEVLPTEEVDETVNRF